MDKIKPDTKVLNNWLKKYSGPYVLSAKLDGMSALYINENGEISYLQEVVEIMVLIFHTLYHMSKLPNRNDSVVRGELIIKKTKFQKFMKKYIQMKDHLPLQW